MALQYALGLVSGSRDSISLPITVWDDGGSTLDRDAALAVVVANAPATILGCDYTDDISVTERSASAIQFSVAYKRVGVNTVLRRASVTTKSKKIYHFASDGKVYGISGADETTDNASLKWKPDRQGSAAEFNNGKPLTVDPWGETRSFDILTSADMVSDKFLNAMEDLVGRGCFNTAEIWGKAAKTLQAVRFECTERAPNEWEVSFGLAHIEAQTNVDVGDSVQIPALYGNETYWPVEKEVYDSGSIQPKVVKVVVGQAWPTGDFTLVPQSGNLTTRTSDTAGVITSSFNHGITTGTIDIFWDGGYRTGTVSGVTSTTITFSSGSGDNLPIAGSVVVFKQAAP